MSPLARYVVRNLGSRPFITALVLGSMTIVGATLAGVTAAGFGLRDAFSAKGHDNWVMVTNGYVPSEKDSVLNVSDLGALTVDPAIKRASPESVSATTSSQGGRMDVLILRGLEPQGFAMHGMQLTEGRMPEQGKPEVIVGETLLRRSPWLKIGSSVTLQNATYNIVGTFRVDGYIGGELWTTRATVMLDSRRTPLSVLYLEAATPADADEIIGRIKSSRSLQIYALRERQFYASMLGQYKNIELGLLVIFSLVVSGAVMTATMVLAVLQQRRLPELCVMRAMGFRDRVISMLILYETELIVLSGGAIGAVIAAVALKGAVLHAVGPSASAINFNASLTPPLIAATFGLLFLIGLCGSILPIARMRRTPITRGLREE